MRSSGKIFSLLLIILLSGCKSTPKVDSTPASVSSVTARDGSSFEQAIVINAKNEDEGIKAEHSWLREHYPGCRETLQALVPHQGRPYDRIDIVTAEGQSRSVYFDLSSFFGKY